MLSRVMTETATGVNALAWQAPSALADQVRAAARQWDERGGAVTKFRVMTALVPRIKSDFISRAGVLYYTGA